MFFWELHKTEYLDHRDCCETRGCRAPFFRKLYAVCGCGNFCLRARLRASGKFFGSFFDLRSGISIFPHMYPIIKIYQQFYMFTERSKIKENSALLQLAVHIYHQEMILHSIDTFEQDISNYFMILRFATNFLLRDFAERKIFSA